MPISAFVTFDIVTDRIAGNDDAAFERGFWWLAARTSLHHAWYLQAGDLTLDRWKMLARASHWAKRHASQFRWSRMVGGNPARGEIYGFSAFDGCCGTLALRNPSLKTRTISASLATLLELPTAEREFDLELQGVFGETKRLEGTHRARKPIDLTLPPLAIAVFEVRTSRTAQAALGAGLLTSSRPSTEGLPEHRRSMLPIQKQRHTQRERRPAATAVAIRVATANEGRSPENLEKED